MDEQAAAEYTKWLDDCYAEAYAELSYEDDLNRLLSFCNKLTQQFPQAGWRDELINLVDKVESYSDEVDDPRANGWVDDRGRP
jgi:hypothetical protein